MIHTNVPLINHSNLGLARAVIQRGTTVLLNRKTSLAVLLLAGLFLSLTAGLTVTAHAASDVASAAPAQAIETGQPGGIPSTPRWIALWPSCASNAVSANEVP